MSSESNPVQPVPSDDPIRNRVAESPLVTLDLEAIFPVRQAVLDVAQWCPDGIVREKEFRAALLAFDCESIRDAAVAVHNPSGCILPQWVPALVAVHLAQAALFVAWCSPSALLDTYYAHRMAQLDGEPFRGRPVLIKGCGKHPVPESAYAAAAAALRPVAKSVLYGEACSTVPLFKNTSPTV
jgi:hypothetical protein